VSIEGALEAALETTPRMPRDGVAVQLALRYAEALDDAFDALVGGDDAAEDGAAHARTVLEIARLGSRLEAMLDRLGMAPSARPVLPTGGGESGGDPASGELDRLRSDAAAGAPTTGVDYAAAVDPAVAEADAED
jgi:hypothetical protein